MKINSNIYYIGGNMSADLAGGAPISLRKIAKEFDKNQKHKLIIVASGVEGNNTKSFGKIPHISFNPLTVLTLKNVTSNILFAIKLGIYFVANTNGLKKHTNYNDIIINNGHWCLNSDVVTMRFCHRSYLRTLRDNKKQRNILTRIMDTKSHLILLLEYLMLHSKRLRYIVSLSKESSLDLIKSYPDIGDKVIIIPNGVDCSKFVFSEEKRENIRKELKINTDATVILFSGHNTYRKNLEGVLHIFMSLSKTKKGIHLIILSGKLEDTVLLKQAKNNENIHFIDWSDEPEVYYSASDIFLFPTFYDTGTKALLEGIINGLYIITSDKSGVEEFIPKDKGVVIYSPFNIEMYKNALISILDTNICNYSKYRKNFITNEVPSWENVADCYYKLIERLICLKEKR